MKVEQVEEQKLGLKIDLQKVKVEQVEDQKLGSKLDLQKVKVEHVEKGSKKDIEVEIVDHICNQKFQKYLDYYWMQKSIVCNVTPRSFKRARDHLSHINHFYIFLPTTCTTTKYVNLDWNDFAKFYKLLYSTIASCEHVLAKFSNLLRFLDSWVVYKEEKGIPLVGLEHTLPSCWRLRQG